VGIGIWQVLFDGNQPWLRNPIIELNGQFSIAMQYNRIGNIMEILQWEL
jgi:hypothetical protein